MFGGRLFARMAPGAAFSEDDLAARHYCFVLGDIVAAAGRILKVKWLEPAEEGGDVIKALLGSAPEDGIFLGISDLERLLGHQSD